MPLSLFSTPLHIAEQPHSIMSPAQDVTFHSTLGVHCPNIDSVQHIVPTTTHTPRGSLSKMPSLHDTLDFDGPIRLQALQQGTDGVQIKVGNIDRAIKPGDAHTEDISEVPQPRRSTRDRKRPRKFDDYELLFSLCSDQTEPQTFKQACSDLKFGTLDGCYER